MNDQNQFVGSGMEGIVAPEQEQKQTTRKTTIKTHEVGTVKTTPVQKIELDRSKTLDEYYNRPLADPNATVLCRDAWGRKVEVHASGWEASRGITRRFKDGQQVYLMHGIMAHTLTMGSVYKNEPTYIQEVNPPHVIDATVKYIEENGTKAPGNDKPGLAAPLKATVYHQREITIGTCPVYEVQIRTDLTPYLWLLVFPDQLTDDQGINGYGLPHKDRKYISESDIKRDVTKGAA